ncbi:MULTISPECIES: Na+/H+ antiporter NhaC family protein [Gemella]|uniref:Na+/H+ antiporter NhaC family protein n=1 Tax=Gemella TaxID=1378 RepID=UPI00076835A2|nr:MULTISPECIES: Na+/H+ antiporter NhaC family protein [Gemella]AME09090.1 sodium:proton antiporter [Gemella sp. oral taxon 928]
MNENNKIKPNGLALLPFIIFVGMYLGVGIILTLNGDKLGFYTVPAYISTIVGIIAAFILFRDSVNKKFEQLVAGCGESNIIIMCLVFLLAGAFSKVTANMGSVDSVVNLGLTYIPPQFLAAGVFIIASFVSFSIGTSVGTVATMGAIVFELASKTGISPALMLATLLCGAMFGDGLTVISMTTIASTKILNIDINSKFKNHLKLVVPAFVLTVILLLVFGSPKDIGNINIGDFSFVKIIPYIFVLVVALIGVNVFMVLTCGIILSGMIGIATKDFTLLKFTTSINEGFMGVIDVLIFSLLIGGLAYMVQQHGGIEWLNVNLKKFIKGKKSAQIVSLLMMMIVNIALANNTVSVIITGAVLGDVSKNFKVDPRKMSSIVCVAACVTQGLIPYGAQALMVTSYSNGAVAPVHLIPYLWYFFLLILSTVISVFIPFDKDKTEWDYETHAPVASTKA